ncbi:MAG: aldo/keto reductase [Clostridia bacterium]|nr:aldo/keto reductase [Clostridia bacterium]
MEYRKLGKTGLKISRLGFGGIPIQRIDVAGTKVLIKQLVDEGINFIDSARGYTVSEEYIGEAIEGVREKFVLATKSMARTKEAMSRDIDISLDNFRTDYIDLYQIHNPSVYELKKVTEEGGALEALMEAKATGKIRHLGVTAHSNEVFEQALTYDWVETVMFPYNIVETQGEELIRKCAEKNVGFICMKPLAGGAIEDATLALRFILSNPNVTVVIPGMAASEEVAQNVAAASNTQPLSDTEKNKIQELKDTLGTQFCRRCGYCGPCVAGINIPQVFILGGYLNRYGLEDWARNRYYSMDKKASDCMKCGACEKRCPYNLPIRKMFEKAAEDFGA